MKKYVWLAVGTVVSLAAVLLLRQRLKPTAAEVELFTVNASEVRQTVSCTGKVESAGESGVYTGAPCVARELLVQEGQTVQAGEVLFTIDTEATRQVLAQLGDSVTAVTTPSAVTAPVGGVVTRLNVQSGELTSATEPCAVIASDDTVHVAVVIREKYLSRVAVGQAVEVTGVAFSRSVYHGTVTYLADTAHQEYLGTVSETVVDAIVTLQEDEIDASLRTGLNAQARVVVNVVENALLVPYTCIAQSEEGEEYVYVYQDNGTAVRQVPQFGEECGDGVLVVSGLAPGARVVQQPETLSGKIANVRVG